MRRLARALATAIVDLARYDVSRHGLALFPDPAQQEELEALAADYAGEVARLRDEGIPGLTLDESCLVISQMQEAQRLKDAGARRLPSHLRQRIRRLRDRTGLPLRTDLL